MKRLIRGLAVALAFAVAVPALAATDDLKDSGTETKAKTKKKLRSMKPGEKTADDRKADAKDSLDEGTAKTKKNVRKGARKVKKDVQDATK